MTEQLKKGLALSGGGYRATLFSLGTLWRFNEEGLLTSLNTITSVSGGAIAAGFLQYQWDKLNFEVVDEKLGRQKATNFKEVVAEPLLKFCQNTIDIPALARGIFNPTSSAGNELAKFYDQHLFHNVRLRDLPHSPLAPEFVFYGTNYDTGVSVRISKDYLRDYHLGKATGHDLNLSQAVCISSSFPPFMAPVKLSGETWDWDEPIYKKLDDDIIARLRKNLVLCDGGLYDNMGIEMLWKHGENKEYEVVFSCDAGAPFEIPHPEGVGVIGKLKKWVSWRTWWHSQFGRMTEVMIDQQRSLRKRTLMRNYQSGEYKGGYWSLETNLSDYKWIDPIITPEQQGEYEKLKTLATRLSGFGEDKHQRLINWGYCQADCGLRAWYERDMAVGTLPFQLSRK